jgi:hypothetical protein
VPPVLMTAEPLSGPPGTVVRIVGQQLVGWRADVTLSGVALTGDEPLALDVIEVTVPAGLDPGFHRLRADVARLTRVSWFFEVTEVTEP